MINLPPSPIGLQQDLEEFELLLMLYQRRQPRKVLEIGSADGGTIWCWSHYGNPPPEITAVSLFKEGQFIDPRPFFEIWEKETGAKIRGIDGNSQDSRVIEEAKNGSPYDWILIDGDHRLDAVKADYANYSPMASPNAVIVFHDIANVPKRYEDQIHVKVVWDELAKNHKTMTMVMSPGLGVGVGVLFMGKVF